MTASSTFSLGNVEPYPEQFPLFCAIVSPLGSGIGLLNVRELKRPLALHLQIEHTTFNSLSCSGPQLTHVSSPDSTASTPLNPDPLIAILIVTGFVDSVDTSSDMFTMRIYQWFEQGTVNNEITIIGEMDRTQTFPHPLHRPPHKDACCSCPLH